MTSYSFPHVNNQHHSNSGWWEVHQYEHVHSYDSFISSIAIISRLLIDLIPSHIIAYYKTKLSKPVSNSLYIIAGHNLHTQLWSTMLKNPFYKSRLKELQFWCNGFKLITCNFFMAVASYEALGPPLKICLLKP